MLNVQPRLSRLALLKVKVVDRDNCQVDCTDREMIQRLGKGQTCHWLSLALL
jgi:hypothetical protein